MNNYFWDFDYKWDLPDVDDLFPNQQYTIRCRKISQDFLSTEFRKQLEDLGLFITDLRANYAPAGVDINNKKYGSIINEPLEQSRIDIVIKGAETSNFVWWDATDEANIINDNFIATDHKARRGINSNGFTRRLSHKFSAALVNTSQWNSIETTTEERFWLKLYYRSTKNDEKLAFYDAKNLLQTVL